MSTHYALYTDRDLDTWPAPEWLIDGILQQGTFALLFGPSGTGKSFVALDLAHAIATGLPWAGHASVVGRVVYVAAEDGGPGLKIRTHAWRLAHGIEHVARARYVSVAVPLHRPVEVATFARRIRRLHPSLVVFDTLSACFVGGDENTAKEMNEFIDGIRYLQQETGTAILVIHHTGKNEARAERGSTTLAAAADLRIRLRSVRHGMELRCEKQKNAPPFAPVLVRLVSVGASCVIETAAETSALSPRATRALKALGRRARTYAAWRSAAKLPAKTFARAVQDLLTAGAVQKTAEGEYVVSPIGEFPKKTAVSRDTTFHPPVTPKVTPPVRPANRSVSQGRTKVTPRKRFDKHGGNRDLASGVTLVSPAKMTPSPTVVSHIFPPYRGEKVTPGRLSLVPRRRKTGQ